MEVKKSSVSVKEVQSSPAIGAIERNRKCEMNVGNNSDEVIKSKYRNLIEGRNGGTGDCCDDDDVV